ncbi:serine hydrolase [Arthrobacter sp. fls2-241-R2A-200]|uniref:serine hydrolase n=1 Tax=unclassified Arthrobacter TaxID=235627 RepID=UPI00254EC0B5|nr:serine hydrolase [Arthrobacter sp. fls2-241-R2A-200]
MATCAALLAVAVPVGVHSAAQARSTSAARSSATKKQASARPAAPPSIGAAAAAGDGVGPDLDAKINGIIDANDQYQVGVALLEISGDAATGQTVHQYGIHEPFEAASTAKVLAAEAYYHLVETGAASLDDQLGAYSAAFQLQAMIQQSDNDSWSLIEHAVGYQGLTDYAASLGVNYNPNDNTLTTADMARILAGLYSGRLLNSADTAQLLSTMQDTNDETLIPAALPAGVTVYHKYGELGGELHDAAILTKDGHTYALVIYTKAEDLGSVEERTDVIHQLTAAVTDAVF